VPETGEEESREKVAFPLPNSVMVPKVGKAGEVLRVRVVGIAAGLGEEETTVPVMSVFT
jgi:hypothetical protein